MQIDVCRMKHKNKEKYPGNRVSVVLITVYNNSLRCMKVMLVMDVIAHEGTLEDVLVV